MHTIEIVGPATVRDADDKAISEAALLMKYDGIEADLLGDTFADYLEDEALAQAGISGGDLRAKFIDRGLMISTTYQSAEPMSDDLLSKLAEYTVGQWADGFGEATSELPYDADPQFNHTFSAWEAGTKAYEIRASWRDRPLAYVPTR